VEKLGVAGNLDQEISMALAALIAACFGGHGAVNDLLRQADGRTVMVAGKPEVLATAGLQAIIVAPDWRTQLLAVITKSNIASLLMLLGAYGLIFELMNPGTVLPGTVGAISLLTALFAFNLLPVDYAGAGLVLLGIALLVAEAFIGTFGALGAGGIIAFLFGSIMMFHGNAPGFGLSLSVVLAATMVSAGVLLLGLAPLLRSRRRPIITGGEAMIRDARQRHRPQGASSHSKAERQSR
jgi:membrane-bound serine protease (ClpP class)